MKTYNHLLSELHLSGHKLKRGEKKKLYFDTIRKIAQIHQYLDVSVQDSDIVKLGINYDILLMFVKLKARLPHSFDRLQHQSMNHFKIWFNDVVVKPKTDEESVYWDGSEAMMLFQSLKE